MKYKNFFETTKEANIRLRNTIIWYDGPGEQGPYHVFIVCGSADEFKIYMKKLGQKLHNIPSVLSPSDHLGSTDDGVHAQAAMDQFMKNYPKFNMVRKDLSSPHFKAFRPFPLGMMNLLTKDKSGKTVDHETLYLERQPNRLTQQGLIRTMIYTTSVNAAMTRSPKPLHYNFDMFSEDFYDCIMGNHPSIDTCLTKLTDHNYANEAAAFHRYFAIVKGPIGMLFLSYKGDVIGLLDNNNLSSVTMDRDYQYAKEVVDDLRVFKNIR